MLKRNRKPKTILWANKVIATLFRDERDKILINYLEKDKTNNQEQYFYVLESFIYAVKEILPHLAKKEPLPSK